MAYSQCFSVSLSHTNTHTYTLSLSPPPLSLPLSLSVSVSRSIPPSLSTFQTEHKMSIEECCRKFNTDIVQVTPPTVLSHRGLSLSFHGDTSGRRVLLCH